MLPIVINRVAWSVGWSVCRSATLVSPAKTAAPIGMLFGLWAWIGPRNRVRWGLGFLMGRGNFGERGVQGKVYGRSAVRCAKKAEPIDLGCGLGWAEGSTISIVFGRWRQRAAMGGHIGATWRIRLNRLLQRCGLMSNYFDHLLLLLLYAVCKNAPPVFLFSNNSIKMNIDFNNI